MHLQTTCDPTAACLASTDIPEKIRYEAPSAGRVYVILESFDAVPFEARYNFTIDVIKDVCGDGFLFSTEMCDDGNTANGDGCSSNCTFETGWGCSGEPSACMQITCGDGMILQPETCDDGNSAAGTGVLARAISKMMSAWCATAAVDPKRS
jgi:cysteine-rich repeat protein